MAKYRGKYKAIGWDKLREQRFTTEKTLGLHIPNTKLPPLDSSLTVWSEIKDEDRDQWAG